jgi:iron complex outermembrane receptor protein
MLRRARICGALRGAPWLLFALVLMIAAGSPAAADEDADGSADEPRESELVEEVIVTGTRAGERTPATFTNVSEERIDEHYWAQDTPQLLEITPSVYAYSDAGNGIGYSYLRLRGFDQQRVAVTINGVPLNRADTHEVFWIDLPAFADVLEDIQVQRGVGTTLYGAGAIGGSINLETVRLEPGERWWAEAGYGSYDTSKVLAGWSSDLLPGGWLLGVNLARIATDGYRDQSWTRMGTAFFTAQRSTPNAALRINLYGGKERTHLAYIGLTREQLAEDRRQNPSTWPGEQDDFLQPHLQVLHEWRPNARLELANTVYAIYGRGFFDLAQGDMDLQAQLFFDEPGVASNSFVEHWIKEWDTGWLPRVTWDHGSGTLTAGAELRIHRDRHWGNVEADGLPEGVSDGFRYYDYDIHKDSLAFYLQEEWRATDALTVMAGLQHVDHSLSFEDVERLEVLDAETGTLRPVGGYEADYSWWAPRIGVHWKASERLSGFASIAEARREPSTINLYDPLDPFKAPAFANFGPDGMLSDPLPEEEKMTDIEVGLNLRARRAAAKLTLYDMDFEDELVYLGRLNELGQAITGNADSSTHRGVELEATARLAPRFDVQGYVTVSEDEYDRFVTTGWTGETVDYSGNRIAGFPERLARLALVWRPGPWRFELGGRHVGRIYIDNTETEALSIDPYTTVHLDAQRRLFSTPTADVEVRLRVENLLDEEYETFGFVWDAPRFLPAADRNVFVMLSYSPRAR